MPLCVQAQRITGGAGNKRNYASVSRDAEQQLVKDNAKKTFETTYALPAALTVARDGVLFLTGIDKNPRSTLKQLLGQQGVKTLRNALTKFKSSNQEGTRIQGTGDVLLEKGLRELNGHIREVMRLKETVHELYALLA